MKNAISSILSQEPWITHFEEEVLQEKDFFPGMSEFQIRNFVLNIYEFPTTDAVIGQCTREIYARIQNIFSAKKDWADAKASTELAEARGEIFLEKARETDSCWEKKEQEALARLEENKRDFDTQRLKFIEIGVQDQMRQLKVFWEVLQKVKQERSFATIEEAEELNWKSRSLFRLLQTNEPLPPWTPGVRTELEEVAQEVKKLNLGPAEAVQKLSQPKSTIYLER